MKVSKGNAALLAAVLVAFISSLCIFAFTAVMARDVGGVLT